jgi:hypothetical protein
MPTDQQIEANRLNSQKSTGPCTEEGKACSSMNAVKSGIYAKSTLIRGENRAELEQVVAEYDQHCHPATPQERVQVDIMVRCTWRGRRYDRAETEIWNSTIDDAWKPNAETSVANAFAQRGPTLYRLDRLIDANERRLRQANAELDRLQSDRRTREAALAKEAAALAKEAAAAEEAAARQAAAKAHPESEPPPPAQPVKSETTYPEFGFVPQAPSDDTPEVASAPKIGFVAANSRVFTGRKGGRR